MAETYTKAHSFKPFFSKQFVNEVASFGGWGTQPKRYIYLEIFLEIVSLLKNIEGSHSACFFLSG